MYVACIYDPQSLTLMHVCMMHLPMILDADAYVYDAHIYIACIYDCQSLTLVPYACMYDAYIYDP